MEQQIQNKNPFLVLRVFKITQVIQLGVPDACWGGESDDSFYTRPKIQGTIVTGETKMIEESEFSGRNKSKKSHQIFFRINID